MTFATKARLALHILRWRLSWGRQDTHYRFTIPDNPKFVGARDAVSLIRDGSVIAFSGLACNQWPSIVYWAIRETFQEKGHPRALTAMAVGGIGARGRAPGSLEELGLEGLCTRFFTGHTETFKAMLRLADAGTLEMQCLPQGVMALLFEAQGRGEQSLLSDVGIGTFMDPRVGRGTPVAGTSTEQFVCVEGDRLRYRLPKIDVAVVNAPAADRRGNLYVKNASMIAESLEIAKAAKRNGGHVIATVGYLVDESWDEIFLPAEDIDAVVVHPDTEQTGAVKHRKYWPLFTTHSDVSIEEGVARLRFLNGLLGYTPRRGLLETALARLAASAFAANVPANSLVNVGVGLPEEVVRLLHEAGLTRERFRLFSESGVFGGLPAPGVYFGAAVCPDRMISSAATFKLCREQLGASLLGMLQADGAGNINVSKRGEGALHYVGPGGFIDFTNAAKSIFFIGSWMVGGKMRIENGALRILERGRPKFIDRVDEITFSGADALRAGKKVFYVTNVGVFRLTPRGMELVEVVPGVDVRRDILDFCPMPIVLPESGAPRVADPAVLTGKGFRLRLSS